MLCFAFKALNIHLQTVLTSGGDSFKSTNIGHYGYAIRFALLLITKGSYDFKHQTAQ